MKQIASNTAIVFGVGIMALVIGLIMQQQAGETAPLGLGIGAMLTVAGWLGRR